MKEETMKACREKYWEELSDSEKIERMRGEVKRLMHLIDYALRASNRLQVHKHVDGEIVIPLNSYVGGESDKGSRNEKYF